MTNRTYSKGFAIVLIYLVLLMCQICVRGATYTAGVVEYSPEELLPTITPQQLILKNVEKYVSVISKAASHGVDILVFPECGLTGINIPIVREEIPAYLTEIPTVGVNPCDSKQSPEVLRRLSCAAREKRLYLVVNLDELAHCRSEDLGCPSDKSLFYNTNIAFDRDGTIVAKYRKFNLYIEPEFNTTQNPDHSWFDTNFGVKFGMFICFDIMFDEPSDYLLKHDISDFVYSTAWFSELPFLTATSVQTGWAYDHDVNLLAAGYSNTTRGLAGSGIYAGRDGSLLATYPEISSTKLLIAKVTSSQRGGEHSHTEEFTFKEEKKSTLSFFHANLENYITVEVINIGNTRLEYENDGFTCNISVVLPSLIEEPKYRLVAFSGSRTYGFVKTVQIEVCGIVACVNSSLSTCNQRIHFGSLDFVLSNISIKSFSNKHLLSFPITLDHNLLPVGSKTFQYRRKERDGKTEMEMVTKQSVRNILTFSIFRNGDESNDSND